jgi:arginine deiminase
MKKMEINMSKTSETKALKWQDPSKFKITFFGKGADLIGVAEETISCSAISLAELNTTPAEEWIGEEWRFVTGRLEHLQFTLTLKDYNNFTLYKKFLRGIQDFVRLYPNDQKIDIKIETADSFDITTMVPMATFKDSMLISVSGPTLDNSAVASIAEFTVTLKTSYVSLN